MRSLPVWGAWVEIGISNVRGFSAESLPVWGAWVEITFATLWDTVGVCRSPCGERGLKWASSGIFGIFGVVAPRVGSVG